MREAKNQRRVVGAVLLAIVVGYALVWPVFAPGDLTGSDYSSADLPPSWAHPMGTDGLGQDLSVSVAEALRVSLAVAAGAALLAGCLGVAIGSAAAVGGPRVDATLMRFTDFVAAVPHLLATVVVVALFRGSLIAIVLALALTHWPSVARVVRAEAQKVMASGYVAASRAAGASPGQVMRHHLLPAVAGQAGLAVILMVPHAVWHESTLSFLGLGLPPDRPSLGTLIALSQPGLLIGQWWPLVFPTAALIAVTVTVAMLGPARRPRRSRPPGAGGVSLENRATRGGLVVSDLTVAYRSMRDHCVTVVDGVSLEVGPGQLVALTGPSGAGKSSLLDACCGMTAPAALVSGRVRTGGAAGRCGQVGRIPQSAAAAFTPARHVRGQLEEAIAAGRRRARRGGLRGDRRGDFGSVDALCRLVGIDTAMADRYPHQLSGGQLRRLAIAAAVSASPTVILADEPTSGLELEASLAVLLLLRELADRAGLAVLVVTHDLPALTASGAADEILELRAGRVRELRPAEPLLDELVTT